MQSKTATISIESLAYGGDGVGHTGEKVVFVPEGVPGDELEITITEEKKSFSRGRIESILNPSPARVTPFCPYADRCGGCQWQMVGYGDQLEWKGRIVAEQLKRISGIDQSLVEPCLASPSDRAFRTVARYPGVTGSQGLSFGYYERRSHKLVDIDTCPVAVDGINETADILRRHFESTPTPPDLREITIRSSIDRSSRLITIATVDRPDLGFHADALLEAVPDLAGIVHRDSRGSHIRTYGNPYREETINGRSFRIEERSFFQINASQAERLVALAGEMLDINPGNTVADGYGGVGLFSLSIRPTDAAIHLFDLSRSAIKDAKYNARTLGFNRFKAHVAGPVDSAAAIGKADALIIDPPRTGVGKEDITALMTLDPRVIVYISCNPSTLARDLNIFSTGGYTVDRVVPVDMFPHTYHIETAVRLRKT